MDRNLVTEDESVDIQLQISSKNDSEEDNSPAEHEVISALKVVSNLKQFARDDFTAFQRIKNLESNFENRLLCQTSIMSFAQVPENVQSNVKYINMYAA